TVKRTVWPSLTWPTSASLTDAHTFIRLRSLAMRNRLGVLKLDCTVWPRLTRRSMMTPSTGEVISVYWRLVRSLSREAWASLTAAQASATAALESVMLE